METTVLRSSMWLSNPYGNKKSSAKTFDQSDGHFLRRQERPNDGVHQH